MEQIKLHLGCGGTIKEGYVNIDIQEMPGISIDLLHDMKKPLPYADSSVDEIFCHDVIQCFSRDEWTSMKKDWVRVLKPGGKIDIYCHDFEQNLINFLLNRDGEKWGYWLQTIYGGQGDEHDFFKNAFSFEKLKWDFEKEGMERFESVSVLPKRNNFVHFVCYKPIQ